MEEIIEKLRNRKKQLQKECWTNKIRIDEINRTVELLKNTPVARTTDVKLTDNQL